MPWDRLASDSDTDSDSDPEDREGVAEGNTVVPGGSSSSITKEDTELKQLKSSMVETVTLLLRLSMAIRNPTPHDQFINSKDVDMSFYEDFDIRHVGQMYSQADDYLVTRLGRAISRRRQYLKYRETHHKKLAFGLEDPDHLFHDTSHTEATPQSTVASSLPTIVKKIDHIDLTEDSGSETDISEAPTATSVNDTTDLRLPPLPQDAQDGAPFECPLCFMIISVHSTRSWK